MGQKRPLDRFDAPDRPAISFARLGGIPGALTQTLSALSSTWRR